MEVMPASSRHRMRLMALRRHEETNVVNVGLIVRLEAKPGKEAELESFLRDALPLVQAERATTAWFALRLGTTTFGIFDLFPDERARQAHLTGRVAAALGARSAELLSAPPVIEPFDTLVSKPHA
jgi:quinol monooxygenase YgiN